MESRSVASAAFKTSLQKALEAFMCWVRLYLLLAKGTMFVRIIHEPTIQIEVMHVACHSPLNFHIDSSCRLIGLFHGHVSRRN